jgi:hypothetical protein
MKKILLFSLVTLSLRLSAQEVFNYDESKVGNLPLPALLTPGVKNAADWERSRRPEILQLFTTHMYGVFPGKPSHTHTQVQLVDSNALGGKAISKQIRLFLAAGDQAPFMDILLFLPKESKKPVPVFIGCNFLGNHTVSPETNILVKKVAHPVALGFQERRWEVARLIEKGYALATYHYGDLEADSTDGWKTGIRTTLQQDLKTAPDAWAALGVWGWGLSRLLDYLETEKAVNAKRVIATGHSRLGKAALWAVANDPRFAAVISNNSGEGGAALSTRWYGETIERINTRFPYWFTDAYKQYNKKPETLPFDQHMLLALIAPRPLYVASATEDLWTDPKGEFLAAQAAGPVYALFKYEGVGVTEMPAPDHPVGKRVRYHVRTGKHDILWYDWEQYIKFANEELP